MRNLLNFILPLAALSLLLWGLSVAPAEAAGLERIQLRQDPEVVLEHSRFVGNQRAQAMRRGVVVSAPQLYIYHIDHSAAWHLSGYRHGFERELGLTVSRARRMRSMVSLDRLLEPVLKPDLSNFGMEDLGPADVYVLLYHQHDCENCEQVEAGVQRWLDEAPELDVIWLDVWLEDPPALEEISEAESNPENSRETGTH